MGCLPRSACLRSNELDQIPPILERIKEDKNGTEEHPREDCSVHESSSGIYSSDYEFLYHHLVVLQEDEKT
uniref:Uncharacterized protein n=1 Tax=Tanacetum cinerariifolium TaxID=118510 RepID=A0A699T706_TANCI|nr:hypothetical protein [Tanacetum cinerariifolium]